MKNGSFSKQQQFSYEAITENNMDITSETHQSRLKWTSFGIFALALAVLAVLALSSAWEAQDALTIIPLPQNLGISGP